MRRSLAQPLAQPDPYAAWLVQLDQADHYRPDRAWWKQWLRDVKCWTEGHVFNGDFHWTHEIPGRRRCARCWRYQKAPGIDEYTRDLERVIFELKQEAGGKPS